MPAKKITRKAHYRSYKTKKGTYRTTTVKGSIHKRRK